MPAKKKGKSQQTTSTPVDAFSVKEKKDKPPEVKEEKAAEVSKFKEPKAVERLLEEFLCPVAQELMKNPVIVLESGQTYERYFIEEWFKDHDTDPVSREKLTSKEIIPNVALKNAIGQFKELQRSVSCLSKENESQDGIISTLRGHIALLEEDQENRKLEFEKLAEI